MGSSKGAGASWDGAHAQPEQSAGQQDELVAAAESTARPGRGWQQATSSFRTYESTVVYLTSTYIKAQLSCQHFYELYNVCYGNYFQEACS